MLDKANTNKPLLSIQTNLAYRKSLPALILVGILSVCAANSGQAGSTGMFGVARSQVVRLSTVHIGDPNLSPVQFETILVDQTGKVVMRTTKTLMPGQATFFDVAFEKLPSPIDGNRTQLRAVTRIIGDPNLRLLLSTTVEVFDGDTGKTTTFIGDPED
jgi:hypothetical protein